MERRMAVLATQTLSYEKAASVGEEAAWLSFSDNAVCATVIGKIGEQVRCSVHGSLPEIERHIRERRR
jgi:hypothetical protein